MRRLLFSLLTAVSLAAGAVIGRFAYGETFSLADAMYAPIALRCRTYGAMLSSGARGYFESVVADPHVASWIRDAEQETAAASAA